MDSAVSFSFWSALCQHRVQIRKIHPQDSNLSSHWQRHPAARVGCSSLPPHQKPPAKLLMRFSLVSMYFTDFQSQAAQPWDQGAGKSRQGSTVFQETWGAESCWVQTKPLDNCTVLLLSNSQKLIIWPNLGRFHMNDIPDLVLSDSSSRTNNIFMILSSCSFE